MREIKFRAWDGKSMLYIVNSGDLQLNFGINKGWSLWDPYEELLTHIDGELMQYTGLKDKNGKEIYEGDIVLNNDGQRASVKYDDMNAGYLLEFYELMGNGFCVGIEKVIGNIYENPELLEV